MKHYRWRQILSLLHRYSCSIVWVGNEIVTVQRYPKYPSLCSRPSNPKTSSCESKHPACLPSYHQTFSEEELEGYSFFPRLIINMYLLVSPNSITLGFFFINYYHLLYSTNHYQKNQNNINITLSLERN